MVARALLIAPSLPSLAAQDGAAGRAAFAADPRGAGPPALVWLRQEVMPQQRGWPAQLDPLAAFSVSFADGRMRVLDAIDLPARCYVAGEWRLPGSGTALFECDADGTETVRFDDGDANALLALLASLHVDAGAPPRTIDWSALVGNLAGPLVEGDPTRNLLPLAAARCGEVALALRPAGQQLLRGRSDGGLSMPLVLLWLARTPAAHSGPAAAVDFWQLRAFGSRDGDRAEAVRQLQRLGPAALPGLRALLHGTEDCRVAAIDALLRLQASSELPRIAAAADPALPLATAVSKTAIAELWPAAAPEVRAATAAAIAGNVALAGFDPAAATGAAPADADPKLRRLVMLAVLAVGLGGLWLRERARRATAAIHP